jgi:hypothetical protein
MEPIAKAGSPLPFSDSKIRTERFFLKTFSRVELSSRELGKQRFWKVRFAGVMASKQLPKTAGCVHCRKPRWRESRSESTIAAKKNDHGGWLKLVGLQTVMDLKEREQQSLRALRRDIMASMQPLNAVVMLMLGFPTSHVRLLVWLGANARKNKQLKMGELEQLLELNLGFDSLTSVPKEIGNLKQLRKLTLHFNMLTSLPKEIGDIKQLQFFFLSNNELTSVPKEIGNLDQLAMLHLDENKLTSVPKEIGNLKQLTCLNLKHNKLTSVPQEIENLGQLENLYLNHNKLISVPKEIGDLKQLQNLYLGNNKLTSVPKKIGNLKRLSHATPGMAGDLVPLMFAAF